jgi:hypothetical protein
MPNSYLDSQATYVDRDAMVGFRAITNTTTDTATYTAEDSGRIVIATKSSATQTFTLPAVASGLEFTFVCGHASGEILINPTGSVVLNIKASEGGAAVATAAGTGIKNTAASNILGDNITLICDGTAWYGIKQSGTWASQ